MTIILFETTILIISLFFWSSISPQIFTGNIILSIIIGIFIGILDFLLTRFFAERFKRSKNFMLEYHDSYKDSSIFHRFLWKPLLISVPEELFFRGLLNFFAGWFWSNIIFALTHIFVFKDKIFTFFIIFLYGLTFFIPFWISGTLVGSIVAHYVFTITRIYYFTKK